MGWTLGDMRDQDKYLWSSCPRRTVMLTVDLDALIAELGRGFDVTGGALEAKVPCPCGDSDHQPYIGVGDRMHLRGGHTTPHDLTPMHEATMLQLELNHVARKTNPLEQARHDKLQRELEVIRERKRRRRARDPYDFG